jgi:hypothetical protein
MTARQTKQREVLVEENTANSNALKDRGNSELTSLSLIGAHWTRRRSFPTFNNLLIHSRGDVAPQIMQMRNTDFHKHRKLMYPDSLKIVFYFLYLKNLKLSNENHRPSTGIVHEVKTSRFIVCLMTTISTFHQVHTYPISLCSMVKVLRWMF